MKPTIVGAIENQNLHALSQADMIIIAPKEFISEAERLADAHRAYSNLIVHVVNVDQVYNEFSSGMKEATAYRRLMKMFYDRAEREEDMPSYLLLFGDGSFDNRKLLTSNTSNDIYRLMTYQADNSLHTVDSYVSDDYFGLLDDDEGTSLVRERIDIGIGRFPVYTIDQARAVVDKTIRYIENSLLGSWKNQVLYLADDGDSNSHTRQADSVANFFASRNEDMLVRKLFLDAYQQEVTAAGERYPLAKEIFDNYIKSGVLMVNYTGHSGWDNWSNEQILSSSDIDNMYNERLPLWVTASCSFSPFDDYKDNGGERLLRNPNGGASALLTAARVVYGTPNFLLNLEFTKYLTSYKSDGKPYRLGDVIRQSKNARAVAADSNRLCFVLIGDPALQFGSPRTHKVQLETINGNNISSELPDTIGALGVVTLTGSLLERESNEFDATFNGTIYLTVFDKEELLTTLDNDQPDESLKTTHTYRDRANSIFTGSAEVVNGEFTITFMLPKDIRYNFGTGRFVFYASDAIQNYEANGSFSDVIIGGEDPNAVVEEEGPEVTIYLNTPQFKSGDVVNSTPLFVAHMKDESGINTIGSGIGHDIVLKLNNNPQQEYVLNNYYESVLGSYQEGYVHYQFGELEDGKYSLLFRVWDLQNNSSTVEMDFVVKSDLAIQMFNCYVYPNPTSQIAYFVFEHDRPSSKMNLRATVFDISGRRVWQSEKIAITDNSNKTVIPWDLESISGVPVSHGIYLVRMDVTSDNEVVTTKTIKLMINRQ